MDRDRESDILECLNTLLLDLPKVKELVIEGGSSQQLCLTSSLLMKEAFDKLEALSSLQTISWGYENDKNTPVTYIERNDPQILFWNGQGMVIIQASKI